MSSAALQVQALQQELRERGTEARGLEGLVHAFFPKATEIIDTPWTLAASQDLAYTRTQEERPPDLEEGAQYFANVDALTAEDVEVHRLMVEVLNLARPLSALRGEQLRCRVETHKQTRPASLLVGFSTVSREDGERVGPVPLDTDTCKRLRNATAHQA
jgi:hypothetical protein